jgi:hypothetical protein
MYISAKPKGINSNQNKDKRIFSNGVSILVFLQTCSLQLCILDSVLSHSPNKESVIADINPFLQSC